MTNASEQELNKFNKIAKEWWDPTGPMEPLHQLNPVRLAFIQSHASLAEKTVLDIGCGAGLLSEAMAKAGANVTSLDAAEEVLAVAKQHAEQLPDSVTKPSYLHTTAEEYANSPAAQKFDVITCMELLEHVPDPKALIACCATLLKPNGKIFFSTINRTLKAYGFAIVGAEYLLRKLPIGTHQYDKFIKPSELNHWATTAKLSLVDLKGMHYSPLKSTFSLEKKTDINYLACYQN